MDCVASEAVQIDDERGKRMSITDLATGYTFETKPYPHQLRAWRISRDAEAYAVLMDMLHKAMLKKDGRYAEQ